MELLSYTTFDLIVYVEKESRVNFVAIFGDLYQNKLWGICNNLNQFTHPSSAMKLVSFSLFIEVPPPPPRPKMPFTYVVNVYSDMSLSKGHLGSKGGSI